MNIARSSAAPAALLMIALSAGCSTGPTPDPSTPPSAAGPTGLVVPRQPRLAPQKARTAAADTLRRNTQHYRDVLAAGQAAWGTPQFGAWQQKTLADLTYLAEFTKADKHFTAADEPASITAWREDAAAAADAINQWAQTNTLDTSDKTSMPNPTQVTKALTKCDKDADGVAAGK